MLVRLVCACVLLTDLLRCHVTDCLCWEGAMAGRGIRQRDSMKTACSRQHKDRRTQAITRQRAQSSYHGELMHRKQT
jgi:hypothetical protein